MRPTAKAKSQKEIYHERYYFFQIDPMTNAFIQMSGVFAELELRIIRERVRSGMANAKAKGAKSGRPKTTVEDIPAVFLRHYPAFQKKQLNVSELARVCELSRTTVYKYTVALHGYAHDPFDYTVNAWACSFWPSSFQMSKSLKTALDMALDDIFKDWK